MLPRDMGSQEREKNNVTISNIVSAVEGTLLAEISLLAELRRIAKVFSVLTLTGESATLFR